MLSGEISLAVKHLPYTCSQHKQKHGVVLIVTKTTSCTGAKCLHSRNVCVTTFAIDADKSVTYNCNKTYSIESDN